MSDIDQRLIRALILLDRQFLITEHVVKNRRPRILRTFEKAVNSGSQSIQDVLRVYEMVFSIVDNLVRYEKIARILPRFNRKSEEFRVFASKLSGLKELRNLLQHINEDIDTEFDSPILGGVTWANGSSNYIAALMDFKPNKSVPGLPFDTQELKYSMQFCFVHDNKYYDLGSAILGYRSYHKYVKSKCGVKVAGKPFTAEEHFTAMRVKFSLQHHAE